MIISKQELLDLFENAYENSQQVKEMNRVIAEGFGSYAESNQLSKKVLNQAYASYKAFKEGKVTTKDDDYFTILAVIEEHFSGEENTNSADSVAG